MPCIFSYVQNVYLNVYLRLSVYDDVYLRKLKGGHKKGVSSLKWKGARDDNGMCVS